MYVLRFGEACVCDEVTSGGRGKRKVSLDFARDDRVFLRYLFNHLRERFIAETKSLREA